MKSGLASHSPAAAHSSQLASLATLVTGAGHPGASEAEEEEEAEGGGTSST